MNEDWDETEQHSLMSQEIRLDSETLLAYEVVVETGKLFSCKLVDLT